LTANVPPPAQHQQGGTQQQMSDAPNASENSNVPPPI
jgi:hypothetical protein